MKKSRHRPEQVAFCLHQAHSSTLVSEICREMGTSEQTFNRWKKKFQGSQITSQALTSRLEVAGVAISMDGRGRVLDNMLVERLRRTVKYEDTNLKGFPTVVELCAALADYFWFYNHESLHQSLEGDTPAEVYLPNLEAMSAFVGPRNKFQM